MIDFTVIIPMYNVEVYIAKCLQSLRGQTHANFEVVIIDDGSTDSSAVIADTFCGLDKRFSVHRISNGGQALAREYGLNISKGNYIIFVDADDWVENYYLENAYRISRDESIDFINFGFDFFNDRGDILKKSKEFSYKYLTGVDIFNHSLIDDNIYTVVWNKVIRADFLKFNNIKFPDLSPIEDIFYTRMLSHAAQKVAFDSKVVYHAYSRPSSSSRVLNLSSFIQASRLLHLEIIHFNIYSVGGSSYVYMMSHVLKFYSYLIVQACYRVQSYSEFIRCMAHVNGCPLYRGAFRFSNYKCLAFLNIAIIFACKFPRLLRFSTLFLSRMGIRPY